MRIHHVSVCCTLVLSSTAHSQSVAWPKQTASPCLSAIFMSANLSLVNPTHCFVFNISCDWMRPSSKLILWKAVHFVVLLSPPKWFKTTYTWILIRSRTPIRCQAQSKSPKSPCHSSMNYLILSPSGVSSDRFSAHTTLLRLSSLQPCCPHDEWILGRVTCVLVEHCVNNSGILYCRCSRTYLSRIINLMSLFVRAHLNEQTFSW